MQAQQTRTPPLGVVFDTSLEGEIDQVLALAMLFGFEGARQIRVPSLSASRFNLQTARFLDLMSRFFGGEQAGDFVVNRNPLPIGMLAVGKESTNISPMLEAVLLKNGADGRPIYVRTLATFNDTADAAALIRNGLSAQVDQNAAVVLAGPPTNLLSVISRPDGLEWVTKKARTLSVAAGRFDGGVADPVVRADVAGFRKLLADWPTRIVMAGVELNDALPFPGRSLEGGIAWASNHPVVDAYRAFKPLPYDAPSRALAAVLSAVSPDEGYFQLSEPGTIRVLDDGR